RWRAASVAGDSGDAGGEGGGGDRGLFVFGDTYHLEPEPLFRGLRQRLPGVTVVGGGASEDGSVGEVSVFSGNAASSAAVAGVALEGSLRATVGVTHALRRTSPVWRVTAARDNWIIALDGRPARGTRGSATPARRSGGGMAGAGSRGRTLRYLRRPGARLLRRSRPGERLSAAAPRQASGCGVL